MDATNRWIVDAEDELLLISQMDGLWMPYLDELCLPKGDGLDSNEMDCGYRLTDATYYRLLMPKTDSLWMENWTVDARGMQTVDVNRQTMDATD